MAKALSYISFLSLPVKVRKMAVSEALISNHGYDIPADGNRREKAYNKALADFQKSLGLSANCVVCETTFDALGAVYTPTKQ